VFNPDHSLSPWYGSASNIYTFGLGISQVEWKVEDEFGNTTFCLQEVQILEVPVTVDAGSDMGICAGQSYQLNGSVTNTMTFEWSTSGTGSFDNPNALNPVYTPSYGDILDVQVTITLTATGPCSTVSDQMVLTIFPPPVANAGIDAVICLGDSYQIVTASADHYTGLSWTHNGLGTLLGSNTLTPVYQSASGETGIVTLELTVEGYGTCGSVTDVMTITIAPSPEADAGVNTDLCGESYALLNGNFVPDAIVEWSQVGGPNQAFLFNANTNNALAFGIINGTYTFSYTVTIGSCVSTDEVVITNWQPPVCCISAGSDLIICDDDEVILTGTLPLVGDLLWSQVNGPSTAVIQTPDNYQTLVTGLVPGVYTFKYANFNGPACDTICDFVSVTVYEPPVAFAGVDTVICQNYSYEINDATASGYNSLEWSTSGTGSFSDVTALNPVYTPSQTDIINGSVQLKLKAYGSVHCPIAISTMILTIQAPADIQAVDDVGTPVNGYTGGIAVLNVLTNDLLNGQAVVDFTNVTLTVIEPASSTGVNLDINTGQVTVDIATNPGIYTIKYRICENLCPDNCSDAIVTITVLVPVPPDSTVVECLSHAIPPVAPEVVDVVCGGLVTSTYVFIDDPDPLVCEGSRVYIYTYEDCAQNRFTWTYTYNVERSTPPVIAAGSAVPTSSVVECYSSVVPPELPVVIDVCDNVLNPVDGSPVISGTYDGCEGTVVYTYTYKDCADLPFVWTYTYTIEHSTGPVMSKPAPVSSIVECYADITEPELPTVVDACGNVLSPTVSSPEVESNYDNCEGTVTYTYTFKDCAGLELAWNYTYTIDLQTAPVVPDNGEATVNCFADASEPILPEVYDHCGNIITAELISVIDDPDMYACEGSRVYTYKYTDCAGNSSDWQLTYYIELTTSPEVPANGNATVNCISDAVPPQIPEITDACGNVLTPELVEIVTEPQDIVCSGTRIYKYEFQDCAGNISYWMFTYTISRYTPPHVQVPAPNKATVTCLEDAVWPTQMPVVVDACGNVLDYTPPVNITTMGYNNGVMCDGGYKRYTFKYKDPCNPSIEMSWVFMYTVLPQTGPELIDQLAGCNILNQDGIQISLAEAQLFDPASLEASVAALYMASCGDVDANLINTTYTGNDLSWTGIYTYKIFDRCDNFQICQVMYSGGFVGGPTLIDPLEDCSSLSQQNINQCFAYVEAFDGTTLESDVASLYTYFGEPVTATLVDSDVSGDDCNWLAIYTFDIKGEVGESVSCQVFYTGGDTEAPVLIGDLPQGKTGMNLCFADIPEGPGADEIKALFTDNCSEVTVVKSGTPTGDNCNWSVTYVYDITDECGNAADQIIITYSGSNQTPPIVPDAINVAVNCKSQVVEPDILPVVTAACGDTLTYSLLSVQEIPPAFTCEGNIIYTYRFTDECGLYSDWTYNYTVERTTPPHQVGGPVPATKTVACLEDAVWPEQLPVVVDACGNILDYTPPVNITTMGYSQGEMCNGGYKRYTFKYKDPCNPAIEMSWVFRYEILPTTTPVLKDELVSCSSLDQTGLTWTLGYAEQFDPAVLEGDVAALYKDVCGDDITATHIRTEKDHQSELGLVTVWNFYYTFKIENSCGNYVECEVHYNGSEVPTTLTLENITVEIDDVMCFGASEVLTVSDVVVKDGGDLTLIAGQSIKLLPGFTVEEGGYLHAYISDTYCANPTPLVVAKDSESTLPETITELIEDNLLFKVYPNPTLDNFTLDMIDYDEAITVEVYDLLGDRIIIKQLSGAKKYEFNLTKQARGVYIIRVFTTEDSGFERIIKQ
ncbi:MAG: T9SS type A sorting domain-containing protein, partial [Bacteroidales bacterium]|nr:T9SS type A sorting domain-containing protein [Bacteroidales bacterium]